MARLPQPGKDSGTWGNILNDYLSQTHKSDGSLKDNIVGTDQLVDNAVTNSSIAPGAITATEIADNTIQEAQLTTAIQTKLNQAAPTWTTLSGKPTVIGAGASMKIARDSIGSTRTIIQYYDIQERQSAACDGVTDDTAAWEAAIDEVAAAGGGDIWFQGISLVSQIVLKSKVGIVGFGWGASRIYHKAGASAGQHCIVLEAEAEYVTLRNFAVLGRSQNQIEAVDCIHFDNPTGTASSQQRHRIENLLIHGAKGNGLYWGYGMRASIIQNIVVHSCDAYGVRLTNFSDGIANNIDIGQSGDIGCFIHACNNARLSNFKSWFSGRLVASAAGFRVESGNTSVFSNFLSQENKGTGMIVDGTSELTVRGFTSDADNVSATTTNHGLQIIDTINSKFDVTVTSRAHSAGIPYGGVTFSGTNERNTIDLTLTPGAANFTVRASTGTWSSNDIRVARPIRTSTPTGNVGAQVLEDREHRVTLTGNRTVNSPGGLPTGMSPAGLCYRFIFTQDATGGRTLTWPTAYKIPSGVTFNTTASTRTIIEFECLAEGDWVMTTFITGIQT